MFGNDRSVLAVFAVNGLNGILLLLSNHLARRSTAVRSISQLSEPGAIGVLVDIVALGTNQSGLDDKVVKAARETLLRLLTPYTIAKIQSLDAHQRASACRLLKSEDESRFARKLVLLLGRVGSEESIQALERVVAGKAKCCEPHVCQAAENALAAVRARVAKAKEEAVLLRPSESDAPQSSLLRPVAGRPSENEALLLRAESGDRIPGQ